MALTPDADQFSQFLRLAFLRSPNFVTGVSGWTINQDGSAEFNNVTVRGTISSANFFVYSPSEGIGNLIASAGEASTDKFGNKTIPGGFATYNNALGVALAYQSNGLFGYTGSLAAGWTLGQSTFTQDGHAVSVQGRLIGLITPANAVAIRYISPSGDATGATDLANINGSLNGTGGLLQAGATFLLPGTYFINGTITPPNNAVLTGPPSAINTTPGASDVMPVIIKLANTSNVNMLSITGNNVYVGNLELDGNKAHQTAGSGINYNGGFFATFENLFIHDQFGNGIVCTNGSACQIRGCSLTGNGGNGITADTSSNDLHIRANQVGRNGSHGIALAGFVSHVTDNDIFTNTNNGILLTAGRGHQITGNGIDHNGQHGISIAPAAATAMGSVSITGNTLHSNSQNSNAGFNNINVANPGGGATADGVTIAANNFWLDGGIANLPNWHINYSGGVVTKTHGNQFQAASSVAGTISAASQVKDANETA